ncbi:hypothetical protein ABOM_001255 [Aspergillus bombycis]|uniref:Uncharacterized protein n=1 Tax=Aspergillus bombycis TaxID=109264 RepID=A0A1F8AED9_9EURO|nr:hypothetical protein ABOM_001255 [Aspergillus bombycis]OGM50090.1 hypothetical protein ABOM_001255 [Aspergillus bombycis]
MASMSIPPSETISPPIFYWGTPVVLITTENEDGTSNIAPMSSAWWLGNRCMLGLGAISQTTINLIRTKQCVLNLASDNMAAAVNALARTTGSKEVSTATEGNGYLYFKRMNGYKYMEAELKRVYEMMQDAEMKGFIALEVQVLRTHVHENIRMAGHANRIDPDKWHPLIMSFQELYGLSRKKTSPSILAKINEEGYRPFSNPVDEEVTTEKDV